ncbi:hypothetical protein ACTMSW_00045 [Micromonospora sp. BQ11]|uniref:hypothetical protein n=1 Tax=Micromonospora sp. BQ11 TaxID=3452212 RepID=UPI003F8B6643
MLDLNIEHLAWYADRRATAHRLYPYHYRWTNHGRLIEAPKGFRRLLAVRLGGQFTDGVFQAALAGSVLCNPDRQATPAAIAFAAAVPDNKGGGTSKSGGRPSSTRSRSAARRTAMAVTHARSRPAIRCTRSSMGAGPGRT